MYRICFVILLFTFFVPKGANADTTASGSDSWRPSPGGAALRSLAIPGWGQSYNGHNLKATIVGTVESGIIFGIVREHQLFRDARRYGVHDSATLYKDQRNRLVWILAGWLIYSSLDAFVDAHLYDFDVSDQLTTGFVLPGDVRLQIGWMP